MFISIDALEEILGMDLFYCLPDVVGAQRAAEIEAGKTVSSSPIAVDLGLSVK